MTENILHNVINGGVLKAITIQSGLKDATINMNVELDNRARNATRSSAFKKTFDSNTLMSPESGSVNQSNHTLILSESHKRLPTQLNICM